MRLPILRPKTLIMYYNCYSGFLMISYSLIKAFMIMHYFQEGNRLRHQQVPPTTTEYPDYVLELVLHLIRDVLTHKKGTPVNK